MRIGVIGGGQLGMMLAQAGTPLGHTFRFWDTKPGIPAAGTGEVVVGSFADISSNEGQDALDRFCAGLDVVTYEFENIPAAVVHAVAKRVPVHPGVAAIEVAQERLTEKQYLNTHNIPTARFAPVDAHDQLTRAAEHVGLPLVMKTRTLGYDGKGQALVRTAQELEDAWRQLGGGPVILEELVPLVRELSLISVRAKAPNNADGTFAFYPLVENEHQASILRKTIAPAPGVSAELQECAQQHARALMTALDYVGVMTIEYFVVRSDDGTEHLLANEIAPRVHNSGHWSIEGTPASQFENHIRAITGMELASATPEGFACMLNLVGVMPSESCIEHIPDCHFHSYNKSPRPGRKLGHITVCAATHKQLAEKITTLEQAVFG